MPIGDQIGPIGILPSGIIAEKASISGQVLPGGSPGEAGPSFRRAKIDSLDRETFARVPFDYARACKLSRPAGATPRGRMDAALARGGR